MFIRSQMMIAVMVVAAALSPAQADGGLMTIFTTNPTTAAGASGSFDILLRNDTGAAVDIAAIDTIMEVALNSGITFTSVDELIAAPYSYVFSTVQNGPLGDLTDPPKVKLSDFLGSGSVTVSDGDVVGLGRVHYTVASSTAAGPVAVSFTMLDSSTYATNIYDASYSAYPLSLTGGTITVTSSGATVPEPLTAVCAPLILAGIGAHKWRKRRAASR